MGVWGALVVATLTSAGIARAEIAERIIAEEITSDGVAPGDEATCLAIGGVWVAAPPHCEVSEKTADADLGWDWSTFGDADADRAVKVAAAWRGYFEGLVRGPKLYAKPFLLTTAAFVTKVDAALARAAKADAADMASKDPRASARRIARRRAVATWAALRADVVAVEAAVRKKLPTPPRPASK
jgi:hypothetical protein